MSTKEAPAAATAASKKAPKKSPKKTETTKLPKRLVPELSKRVSKKPELFINETVVEKKEPKKIVIPKGKGTELGEIPHIKTEFNKRRASDEAVIALHSVLLGKPLKSTKVKENLRNFRGLVYDEEKNREKYEAKFARHHLPILRDICRIFGLDTSGDKDDIITRLIDYVEKPKEIEVVSSSSPVKRKRAASSSRSRSASPARKTKKSKKDKENKGPKKPLSAYMFFVKDKRPALAKENPKDKITEIATKLGKAWRKLSEKEKKKYQELAAKDKKRYEKEKKEK